MCVSLEKYFTALDEESVMEEPTTAGNPRDILSNGGDYGLIFTKYKLLFDHARDMILFIDENGRILDANNAALSVYGYSREEITCLHVFDLRQCDSRELVKFQMRQACDSSILFETLHKTRSGSIIPVEVSSTGVQYGGNHILMSIIRDISAKQEYLAKISRLAYYDELTGIPNRKSFRDALCRKISGIGAPFALMLIDLDNFKKVNDSCSHCIGDKFLAEMAAAMQTGLADRGVLYRLGGDEFTVLTENAATEEEILPIVNDIRSASCAPHFIDGCAIMASISVGISVYPRDGVDESLLLKRADAAMYRVKEAGRAGLAFHRA